MHSTSFVGSLEDKEAVTVPLIGIILCAYSCSTLPEVRKRMGYQALCTLMLAACHM